MYTLGDERRKVYAALFRLDPRMADDAISTLLCRPRLGSHGLAMLFGRASIFASSPPEKVLLDGFEVS